MLTRQLALIRPASMSDNAASDWIAAAYAETAHLSDPAFTVAAERARRECNYHGQVIPTMLKPSAEMDAFVRQMDAISKPFLRDHNPPQRALPNTEAQQLIASAAKGLKGGSA